MTLYFLDLKTACELALRGVKNSIGSEEPYSADVATGIIVEFLGRGLSREDAQALARPWVCWCQIESVLDAGDPYTPRFCNQCESFY